MAKRKEMRAKANRRNGYESGVLNTVEKKLGVNTSVGSEMVSKDDAIVASSSSLMKGIEGGKFGGGGPEEEEKKGSPFALGGTSVKLQPAKDKFVSQNKEQINHDEVPVVNQRLLKPLPNFGGDMELRALGETIQRDILQTSPDIKWDDVIELEEAKRLLKEAVVMPLKYPQLFTGLLSPWCGILLYGPPGTGKTMLAKAVASECNTTFFNISASSIVSKYRGDSEKLIRVLFELARYHAPSTVFMDEIDSIMSSRGSGDGAGGEHEGSRRMKTELLIQMDGLSRGEEHVFVLAASNLPWDLDSALLRRLEKRVLVPLPGKVARLKMLQMHMGSQKVEEGLDLQGCANATDGYSGADIKLLCKEAAMRPVRRLLLKLDELETGMGITGDGVVEEAKVQELINSNPIMQEDLNSSAACTNKSSGGVLEIRYESWAKEFGSV